VSVRTSMRRASKENVVRLAFKYLYCELHVITGRPLTDIPFDYEFGAFAPADQAESRRAVTALTERFRSFSETFTTISEEGREALRELSGPGETGAQWIARSFKRLRTDDVRTIERYVHARVRLARRGSRRALVHIRRAADAIRREVARSTS
jgi:hypothetical protein